RAEKAASEPHSVSTATSESKPSALPPIYLTTPTRAGPTPCSRPAAVVNGSGRAETMNILGINAYHPNASAALVSDGRLVTAVEEERFNRVKYAAGFPAEAIRYCLAEAGLTLREIDHIAVPRNPWARLGTKLYYALRMPRFA